MKRTDADALLANLIVDEASANAAAFLQLCRSWPELRHWLLGDFARNAAVRSRFAQVVDGKIPPPKDGRRWLAELEGDDFGYQEEIQRLRRHMFPRGPGIYGGLTWLEIEKLVRKHQSGTLDLGAFILARDWRKAGDSAHASFRLARSAAAFVDAVVRSGRPRLLRHFGKAVRLAKDFEDKTKRRAILGNDWWKLHVLFYMWRHPSEGYRTRDLRAHLATLGVKVTTKAIRRFCKRHGIQRDERAGRPRTHVTAPNDSHAAEPSNGARNGERPTPTRGGGRSRLPARLRPSVSPLG